MTTTIEGMYATHQKHILNYLYRMVGNPSDAEELTQETFLRAHQSFERGQYDDRQKAKPWLFRIATNVAMDELRRRKVVRWESIDANRASYFTSKSGKLLALAAILTDRANVEREAVSNEDVVEVRTALDGLSRRYRTVLVLRYHEGLSCEEIAVVFDTTRGAVKSLLFRARAELRQHMEALEGRQMVQGWAA